MNEEEIIKQYANGIVDIDELVGSLIDKFKTDKTSVDIQQLQLVAEYLIYKADKLQKENEDMREELQMYVDTPISKLKEENKVLRGKNKYLQGRLEFRVNYCNELEHELYEEGNYIHKEVIRKKIKELEEELVQNYGTLGESLTTTEIKTLKKLLGE